MVLRKEELVELIRQLPDEIDVEELIYRLYLREKLLDGREFSVGGSSATTDGSRP